MSGSHPLLHTHIHVHRHPDGTLWTLNRAKLERINGNADKAIEILGNTLKKDGGFPQAEVIIVFEYAWLLLAENKWVPSGDAFSF